MEPGQDHLVRILALARRADCWESLDRLVVDEDPQASAARAKTLTLDNWSILCLQQRP